MNTKITKKSTKRSVAEIDSKATLLFENSFTADNLIDAWIKGYEQGGGNAVQQQFEFVKLFQLSSDVIKTFYHEILESNMCFSVFMKMIPDRAYFITAIDTKLYFDDEKCRPIYEESARITRDYPQISISFMPCDSRETINRVSLFADNYVEIMK